eukprot:scaffold50242_cov64-Phaeocystis_antarctica.AAC.3
MQRWLRPRLLSRVATLRTNIERYASAQGPGIGSLHLLILANVPSFAPRCDCRFAIADEDALTGCDAGRAARRRIPAGHRGLPRHRRPLPWASLRGGEGSGVLQGPAAAAPPAAASRGRPAPRRHEAPRSWPVVRHAAVRGQVDVGGVGAGAAGARVFDQSVQELVRRWRDPQGAPCDPGPCDGEARGSNAAGRALLAARAQFVVRGSEWHVGGDLWRGGGVQREAAQAAPKRVWAAGPVARAEAAGAASAQPGP